MKICLLLFSLISAHAAIIEPVVSLGQDGALTFEDFNTSLGLLTGVSFRASASIGWRMSNPGAGTAYVDGMSSLGFVAIDQPGTGHGDVVSGATRCAKLWGSGSVDMACTVFMSREFHSGLDKYSNGGAWSLIMYYGFTPYYFESTSGRPTVEKIIFDNFNWDVEYEYEGFEQPPGVTVTANPEPGYWGALAAVGVGMWWRKRKRCLGAKGAQ